LQINENEIKNVTINIIDTQVLALSNELNEANLDPRIIITAAGLAWYDLDTEILEPLDERRLSIQNAVIQIWYNIIDIEYLLLVLARDVKFAVDNITTGLVSIIFIFKKK
jgi:hypothetical protein